MTLVMRASGQMGTLLIRSLALAILIAAPALRLRACRDQHRPRVADNDRPFRLGRGLCPADILGQGRLCNAERRLSTERDVRHGSAPPSPIKRQRRTPSSSSAANTQIHGRDRGWPPRPAGVARNCVRVSPAHAARLVAMAQKEGVEIRIVGSPFSDIARSERRFGGYAPVHLARTLKELGARSARAVSGQTRPLRAH